MKEEKKYAIDKNEPVLINKIRDLLILSNVYLNHAPRHEKYSLCREIRDKTYEVHNYVIEGHKKFQKKTTLGNLDIAHEQLRSLWHTFWKLGYFSSKDGEKLKQKSPLQRYNAISMLINEIGAMIGGWIKADREKNSKTQRL